MENYGDYRHCQHCCQGEQTFNEPMIQPYKDQMPEELIMNQIPGQPSNGQIREPFNGQMPGQPSNGQIGEPFSGQMPGQPSNGQIWEPFNSQMPGQPSNGQMMWEPYNNQMPGMPSNGQMMWEPYNNQMPGQPSNGQMIWEPYDDLMLRGPFNNQMPGQQFGNQMPGQPYNDQNPQPTPFYQMYGYPQMLMEEQENDLDMDRLKEMYPEAARHIMTFVEDECDKLEYEGSFMFDERPDVNMLIKIRNDIYDKVKDNFDLEAEEEKEKEDKDEVYGMNWERSRRFPRNKNWLGDMVDVLLLNEMHRRRCRFRGCCGRWC